jgi:hypothetical protein
MGRGAHLSVTLMEKSTSKLMVSVLPATARTMTLVRRRPI